MWRFVVIALVFMGWAFYQLSGGADYAPAPNSLQAWAKYGHQRPVARPVQVNVIELADIPVEENSTQVTRTVTSLAELESGDFFTLPEVEATLAAAAAEPEPEPVEPSEPVDFEQTIIEARQADVPSLTQPESVLVAIASASAVSEPVYDPANPLVRELDLRTVVGDVVNVREGPGTGHPKVTSLLKDAQVTVLQETGDGWIEVRVVATGDVGWMADWLVTARN